MKEGEMNRRVVRLVAALVVFGLWAGGCRGDEAKEEEALSFVEHVEARDAALCHLHARCGAISDEEACVRHSRAITQSERAIQPNYSYAVEALLVRKGRMRFDRAAADACVKHIRDAPCDTFSTAQEPTLCLFDIFTGLREVGQSCVSTLECDASSYCAAPEDACGEIRCVPRLGVGQRSPIPVGTCQRGLVVVDGFCEAPPKEGDACLRGSQCDVGFTCDDSRCRRSSPEGEPCGRGRRCLTHLRCEEGLCQRRLDEGASCVDAYDCKLDAFCDIGEREREGRCQRWGLAGQSCSSSEPCHPLLVCETAPGASAGTCQVPVMEGGPCSLSCHLLARCDPHTRTCVRAKREGEACEPGAYDMCERPLECQEGRCAFPSPFVCRP